MLQTDEQLSLRNSAMVYSAASDQAGHLQRIKFLQCLTY